MIGDVVLLWSEEWRIITGSDIFGKFMADDMVFARSSGGLPTTEYETDEVIKRDDVSVSPLATPAYCRAGAIGASTPTIISKC